jgi:hypothetical protein
VAGNVQPSRPPGEFNPSGTSCAGAGGLICRPAG